MEEQAPEKKRIRKWPFILLGILGVLGAGAYYVYNKYLIYSRS
jgi:hypothetical protein